MKLLGTGLTGLVGSRIVELLGHSYEFVNYSLEGGVDITDRDDITTRIVSEAGAPWVLHFAAYTNVQQSEADRQLGKESTAWKVNVDATQYIIDACQKTGKRLLYVDTDYAFDGTKKTYTENDVPHPQGWYAITKSEGAARVLRYEGGLVIRISNPYRANPVGKTDFVHKMLERLVQGGEIAAPTDQLFVPTFIDDIARAVDVLLSESASGVYHVVGSQALSPFEAGRSIARLYGYNEELVKKTTFSEYFAGRAQVPQYAQLLNEKITALGVVMRGFDQGLMELKKQEASAS